MTVPSAAHFRRLFPAAVAALTLATSAPFLAPPLAHADTGDRHEQVKAQPPGKIPRHPARGHDARHPPAGRQQHLNVRALRA